MNNLIGYTLTFKSGVPTVIGTDTAIMIYQKNPATYPSGVHRTNYFGYKYAVNASSKPWQNQTYYNTSLVAPAWAAYQPSNSWYGYIPGNAFTNEIFLEGEFKLTTTANAAVNTIRIDNNSIIAYPNPVQRNQQLNISFSTGHSGDANIELVNMFGQKLKVDGTKNTGNGNSIQVGISDIAPGIYFLMITVDDVIISKKINITE